MINIEYSGLRWVLTSPHLHLLAAWIREVSLISFKTTTFERKPSNSKLQSKDILHIMYSEVLRLYKLKLLRLYKLVKMNFEV